MEKGHIRLLKFIVLFFITIVFSAFFFNNLPSHFYVFLLIIVFIMYRIFFGFERNRLRYQKDVILIMSIILMTFFIMYYLIGLVVGFIKVPNYFTVKGIFSILFPIIIVVVLREILRYNMTCKAEGSTFLLVCIVIVLSLFDIVVLASLPVYNTKYQLMVFFGVYAIPIIINNISYTYISSKVGYVPIIYFSLIVSLYSYILPIVPDFNNYLNSIAFIVLPAVTGYRIYYLYNELDDTDNKDKYDGFEISIGYVIFVVFSCVLLYSFSGFFRFHVISVATGSMYPKIKRGDAVVVDKKIKDYESIKKGTIIAYKRDDMLIIHRVIKISKKGGNVSFYTKGDANGNVDNITVYPDMVYGVVHYKIPFIGYPTLWVNELLD